MTQRRPAVSRYPVIDQLIALKDRHDWSYQQLANVIKKTLRANGFPHGVAASTLWLILKMGQVPEDRTLFKIQKFVELYTDPGGGSGGKPVRVARRVMRPSSGPRRRGPLSQSL